MFHINKHHTRNNMKKVALSMILATTMLCSCLSGCSKGTSEGASDEIKIGVIAPLTGNYAEHGKSFEVAMSMAVEEINEAGGINGRKLELTFNDTEGDNKKAADLASMYAEDESYVAMLGGFTSGCAMAAAPICDESGIVLLSPTASNAAYAQMSKYCFSIPNISTLEAPIMVKKAVAGYCGAKSVYVFALNSDWGMGALEGFKAGAEEAGVEILGVETYVAGETDYSAMITKAAAANPEMIVILDTQVATVLNQIRTAGLTTKVANYGSSASNEVITLCGENAEGLVASAEILDTSKEENKAFAENFKERAGFDPSLYAGYAYTTAYIMADAIERCGENVTREAIRDEIAKTDGTYLYGGVTFNENGNRVIDPENASYEVFEVQNGEWVRVQQK